jgi:hypothetical protein
MWHAAENRRAEGPAVSPAEASRSLLQSDAESFLRDSLLLIQQCGPGCGALISEIVETEGGGRFGVAAAEQAALPAGLALPRHFGPTVTAALTESSHGETVVAMTRPAPVHVRIEPSVVVPLPRESAAAPVPAARLDRPAETIVASSAPSQPAAGDVASLGGRILPAPGPVIGRNSGVAVYDISAAIVYLPDGQRLEAHSGLGAMVDNPHYVDRRNTGPTPPNTYDLVMRKGRFHGVEALRLLPSNGDNKYGRVGLLAHTYMLRGRPAQSNGCVAFKDYSRFLDAFKRGSIKRLVVVPSLAGSSLRVASLSGRP